MHGGAKGSGGQPGNISALKTGKYCAVAKTERMEVGQLIEMLMTQSRGQIE